MNFDKIIYRDAQHTRAGASPARTLYEAWQHTSRIGCGLGLPLPWYVLYQEIQP